MSRFSFILIAAVGAFLITTRQNPVLEARRLAPNAHVIVGSGANTVMLEGESGLMLVDTKPPDQTGALLAELRQMSDSPVRYLVYTHHHREVSEGGPTQAAGAITVAHNKAHARLVEAGHPGAEVVFDSALEINLEPLTVSLYHKGPAHTDGDTVIYLHEGQVLILGDLASPGQHPIILPEHGASIREWVRVLRTLRKDFGDSEDTVVVPAHGVPGSMEIIDEQIAYFEDFIAAMEDAHRHGLTLAEARREAAPLREKYAHYRGNGFERNLEVAYRETGR